MGWSGAHATATPIAIASPPSAEYAATTPNRVGDCVVMAVLMMLVRERFTFPWTTGVAAWSENVMAGRSLGNVLLKRRSPAVELLQAARRRDYASARLVMSALMSARFLTETDAVPGAIATTSASSVTDTMLAFEVESWAFEHPPGIGSFHVDFRDQRVCAFSGVAVAVAAK